MDAELLLQVRRFNRTVTQRVGALQDHFLARDRPLGEARLLWEIGAGGAAGRDVRELRQHLDLDSGYISRLLHALKRDGMVTLTPSPTDHRVRRAHLTSAGLAERAELDRRSDELAASLLAPLDARRRAQLVAAMTEVERLLTAALVEIAPIDPAHPAARHCLGMFFAELDRRFDRGFDPAHSLALDPALMRPPAGVLLSASLRGEPIACGALRLRGGGPADIKHLWVDGAARGLGVGRRLLEALESAAAQRGADRVRLDTNGALTEAISLYRSAGYVEVPAFNDEPYAHHWFEKKLPKRPRKSAG